MIVHVAIFVAALAVLIRSADLLVESSARIARRAGVSDLIVGLVITSVGTSLPEVTSSLAAALAGSTELAIGNVVGSNIANIGLVLGIAALIRPFATRPAMLDRDGFVLVASAALVFGLSLNNRIGRIEASFFLLVYVAYVLFAARTEKESRAHRFGDFLDFMFDFRAAGPSLLRLRRRMPADRQGRDAAEGEGRPVDGRATARDAVLLAISLVALILSARFVVSESIWAARALDIPENLIGLSILAVGTSLPELLVAVAAARRGNAELVLGNVMGSNIANSLLILGLAGLLRPLHVPEMSVVYTTPIMIFFSLGLLHFMRSGGQISRLQGAIAVTAYLAFLTAAFLGGWG